MVIQFLKAGVDIQQKKTFQSFNCIIYFKLSVIPKPSRSDPNYEEEKGSLH